MYIKEIIKSTIIDYLKEDYNPNDSMIDILIKGVPFLKEYNIFKHPRDENRLEAQLISRHENVKMKWGDDFITFPHLNVVSKITYYPHKFTEHTLHYFIISNKLYPSKPDEMSDLEFRAFLLYINQFDEKYSYNETIYVNNGESIPKDELNKILNDMNGCLFKIEDFTEKHNINLF